MSFGERCQLFQHFKIDRNLVFGVGERFHTWTNRRIADGGIDCIRSRGYIGFEVENEKGVYNSMLYCVVDLPSVRWHIISLLWLQMHQLHIMEILIILKVCIVLSGLMWSIVMEFSKQELKEYLLGFPQEYWFILFRVLRTNIVRDINVMVFPSDLYG